VRVSTNCAAIITATAIRNAGEMPSAIGFDRKSNASPIYAVREFVSWYASPRAPSSTPSDTMNDGIRQPTVTAPVSEPVTVATAMPLSAAGNGAHCHFSAATLTIDAASARTEPTDRSMPAMISTNVMPTDITTRSGIWFAIVLNVS
jgi:hypothetical protein